MATFGPLFVGAMFSNMLYGITCAQASSYYRTYGHDRWIMKCLVAVVWVIGTLQQCLIFHTLWYYLISQCNGDPRARLYANWSLIGETIPSEICFIIVQCFYIFRIWRVGQSKWAFVLVAPAVIGFAAATAYIVEWYQYPAFKLDTTEFALEQRALSVASASYALTDLAIAATMCYLLHRRQQGGLAASRSLITVIINYTISTGLLSSIVAVAYLSCYAVYGKQGSMVNIGVYFVHAPIYVNSMLASLNSRKVLQQRLATGVVQGPYSVN